ADQLDFMALQALTFRAPDAARYPGLQLAWETLNGPEGSTCVLNAANEVAVASFLEGRLRFDQIHAVNAQTLSSLPVEAGLTASVEGLLSLDAQARRVALSVVGRLA
ncbi:MAG: hypothetical protein RLZZ182_2361, partial [Pseudomonadota bacterium]